MTRTAKIASLIATARDEQLDAKTRYQAMCQAEELRKTWKAGWASLGQTPAIIEETREMVNALDIEETTETVSEPAAPKTQPAAQKAPKDETRGLISRMVRNLLLNTSKPYSEIVEQVRKHYPDAKTSARSVASVAADMRKAGQAVAHRRVDAAAK